MINLKVDLKERNLQTSWRELRDESEAFELGYLTKPKSSHSNHSREI